MYNIFGCTYKIQEHRILSTAVWRRPGPRGLAPSTHNLEKTFSVFA